MTTLSDGPAMTVWRCPHCGHTVTLHVKARTVTHLCLKRHRRSRVRLEEVR